MLTDLKKDLESAADMVNRIEVVRSQLATMQSLLTGADAAAVSSGAESLDKKLADVEDNLIQRRLTGAGQDGVRWPVRLISKINYLANGLISSDFGPTTQQREVHALFKEQLATHRKRLDELMSKDLRAFNELLKEKGVQNIILTAP